MKVRLVVALFALLAASRAFAQSGPMSPARAGAVHECAVASRSYSETTWASMQTYQYRACMMRRGQTE